MAIDLAPKGMRDIWQSQEVENTKVSPVELRKGVRKLEKAGRRRSLVGGGACALVIACFGSYLLTFPNLIQCIGCALIIVGAAYLAYQLVLIRTRPEGTGAEESESSVGMRFYRAELERQRDFHRGLWFWSRLVIFVPGPLVFFIGIAVAHPEVAPYIYLEAAAFALFAILAVPLNLRRARSISTKLTR